MTFAAAKEGGSFTKSWPVSSTPFNLDFDPGEFTGLFDENTKVKLTFEVYSPSDTSQKVSRPVEIKNCYTITNPYSYTHDSLND